MLPANLAQPCLAPQLLNDVTGEAVYKLLVSNTYSHLDCINRHDATLKAIAVYNEGLLK